MSFLKRKEEVDIPLSFLLLKTAIKQTKRIDEKLHKDEDLQESITQERLDSNELFLELMIISMFCAMVSFEGNQHNNFSSNDFSEIIDGMVDIYLKTLDKKTIDMKELKEIILERFSTYKGILDGYKNKELDSIVVFNKFAQALTKKDENDLKLILYLNTEITGSVIYMCSDLELEKAYSEVLRNDKS